MGKFAERLKELRSQNRMTQADLGKLLKVSGSTISMYERGERTPDYETLEALADIFNVDTDYLIGRSNRSMYYIDPRVARAAQDAFDDPDMRMLLSAKSDLDPEDFEYVVGLVKRLKGRKND